MTIYFTFGGIDSLDSQSLKWKRPFLELRLDFASRGIGPRPFTICSFCLLAMVKKAPGEQRMKQCCLQLLQSSAGTQASFIQAQEKQRRRQGSFSVGERVEIPKIYRQYCLILSELPSKHPPSQQARGNLLGSSQQFCVRQPLSCAAIIECQTPFTKSSCRPLQGSIESGWHARIWNQRS